MNFNIEEIIEMAVQIEINGAKYYRKAAELMKANKSTSEFLDGLAKMEDNHEILFKEMKKELSEDYKIENYDPDDIAITYLQSFADGKVFDTSSDPSKDLDGNTTIEEIISFAIGREKDSIAFFMGLREFVPAEFGEEKIRDLILEEMSHIILLNKKLRELA